MNIEIKPTIAVSLTVKNTADALAFYVKAFGAEELFRMPTPDGGIGHAEFKIGNFRMYISDESPEWFASAMPEGTTASSLLAILTEDCDKSFQQAVEAGGEALIQPQDQFWGMRTAIIKDPFGYRWSFRQLLEEVSPEEMLKRAQKPFGSAEG